MQNFVDLKLLASQAIFLCGLVCKVILNAPKNSQQFPMWYLAVSVAIFCVGLYTKRPMLTNLTPPRHNTSKGNLLTCETTFYMPGRSINALSDYLQYHYFIPKKLLIFPPTQKNCTPYIGYAYIVGVPGPWRPKT